MAKDREISLPTMASEIREVCTEIVSATNHQLLHTKVAGDLLLRAKERIPHGEFEGWLEKECKVSAPTARRMMKIAREWPKLKSKQSRVTDIEDKLSLTQALKLIKNPEKKPEPKPPEKKPAPKPGKGVPVPKHLKRIFEGLPKWKEAHAAYGKLRGTLMELAQLHPGAGSPRAFVMKTLDAVLENLYSQFTAIEPTKLCPDCNGGKGGCERCSGRGYLTKG